MLKKASFATIAIFSKITVQILVTAACLTVGFVATAQVSHAQTTYYRNGPGQSGATERDYRYGTWASSGFVGSGFLQSFADQEAGYAYWNVTKGSFQARKGLTVLPEGPDQLWYANISQMTWKDGKGEARFKKKLAVRYIQPGSQIWTGVQGWLDGVEFYILENMDRGGLPIPSPSTQKVGSVTIDGGDYDLYTFLLTRNDGSTWRQW